MELIIVPPIIQLDIAITLRLSPILVCPVKLILLRLMATKFGIALDMSSGSTGTKMVPLTIPTNLLHTNGNLAGVGGPKHIQVVLPYLLMRDLARQECVSLILDITIMHKL